MSDKKNVVPAFTELNEFAALSNGGRVVFSTDDWFAVAENMLQDKEPVFIPDKYTECGKWMDGWETRRKRIPGHDWCIIQLGASCIIKGILVDTCFFTGNYAPKISIQGIRLSANEEELFPMRHSKIGMACNKKDLSIVSKLESAHWPHIVNMKMLQPGYEESRKHFFPVDTTDVCSHIRVNIYPDGGIARIRVYGEVQPKIDENFPSTSLIDLISLENGGTVVDYSNAHFGHPRNLIKPERGINMGDGWETMRRLDRPAILEVDSHGILKVPGCEWTTLRMCCFGSVSEIVVDTNHFKGNYADSVKIIGTILHEDETLRTARWTTILPSQKLSPHKEHFYKEDIVNYGPFEYIRIIMAPDGGISRVRIFGYKEESF